MGGHQQAISAAHDTGGYGSGDNMNNSGSLQNNYDNPNVLEQRNDLGPFNYDDKAYEVTLGNVEDRPEEMLENAAKYKGEWLLGSNIRQGRGMQVWPDGSMYEGYWRENKANGNGRLIHADGDVYNGMWQDDKAHG